jgi:RNA polymerase sigma factor (sigma-70 family)
LKTPVHIEETISNLFRHEWGKLISVLTKLFGPQNLQMAEDVVQDTLFSALQNWKINGLPQNPSAWLFKVARNKAIDVLRHQKRKDIYSKNITALLQSEYTLAPTVSEMVNTKTIEDDQLRMMFVCCHPSLSTEAQVSLILKTLCGFSVTEISKAFVCSYDTIEKRLYRARQTFREHAVTFDLPPAQVLDERSDTILMSVYLLFNEGYNSTNHQDLIRKDLMNEAMRLCELICHSPVVKHSNANALMALMCFIASRNESRLDNEGNILLLKQQDRSKWNRFLMQAGINYLEQSADEATFSRYHLEAGIAYEHARATSYNTTNWSHILNCYNLLYQLIPTSVIALNRAIVISELNGAAEGIKAIEAIPDLDSLKKYYLLPSVLGELYWQLKNYNKAKHFFKEAISLTQSETEKKLLLQKLNQAEA